MQHSDFMKYWLLRDEAGNVLAVDTEGVEAAKLVFSPRSVAEDWYNPLRAAGIMYQQLTRQFEALESFIELAEQMPGDNRSLIASFTALQDAILLTQQVAREGVEKVGTDINKEARRG